MSASALGDADPLVEVEAAVVGAVGDEHHLMATAIGENDEITGLCRALQADLVFGGRQLVGLLPEGEGVGIHMALHRRLIYRHAYNSSRGGRDPRRPSGADGADNVSNGEAQGSGTTTEQDGAAQGDEESAGDAANEALAATWLEVATGAPSQGDIAQMHQADDGADGQVHGDELQRQRTLVIEELGQQSAEEDDGLGVAGGDQKGFSQQGEGGSGASPSGGGREPLGTGIGRAQRLVAQIHQVATPRQLEGDKEGRQGLQQGPTPMATRPMRMAWHPRLPRMLTRAARQPCCRPFLTTSSTLGPGVSVASR